MENFQVDALHLVKPRYIEEHRIEEFACRGYNHFENRRVWDSFEALLDDGFHYVLGTTGKTGAERQAVATSEIHSELSHVFSGDNRVLLVFGRESRGLYNEELQHCDYTLHVPLDEEYPILNLSHAVSIILYEIQKLKGYRELEFPEEQSATSAEIAAFERNIETTLNSFGYYEKKERAYHRRVLAELIRRKDFTTDEVRFLQGFLRAFQNRRT
jgi:TrmH family RNA methyltransferase